MTCDPILYFVAGCMVSAAIGFFGCALFASSRIREIRNDAYWEGYGACNRELQEDEE